MPFKSQAQRRKFAELLIKGEISKETFEEWNRETGSAKLPEYVNSKAGRASRGNKISTPRSKAKSEGKSTGASKRKPKPRGKSKRARK